MARTRPRRSGNSIRRRASRFSLPNTVESDGSASRSTDQQKEWKVETVTPCSPASLERISSAALFVKVNARVTPGAPGSRPWRAIHRVSTRVLPVPGPAKTRVSPSSRSTTACWSGSSAGSAVPGRASAGLPCRGPRAGASAGGRAFPAPRAGRAKSSSWPRSCSSSPSANTRITPNSPSYPGVGLDPSPPHPPHRFGEQPAGSRSISSTGRHRGGRRTRCRTWRSAFSYRDATAREPAPVPTSSPSSSGSGISRA